VCTTRAHANDGSMHGEASTMLLLERVAYDMDDSDSSSKSHSQ